jgi:hypothetical protein
MTLVVHRASPAISLASRAFLAGLLAWAAAPPLSAQDSALTALLSSNRHPISISGGKLAGAGGRLLVEEGRRARFFLVGEEHGVAEMPGLVKALLAELRPAGYTTLAIEVSPLQGDRLDALTRRPGVRAALDTLLDSWLTAVPFYSLAPERDLLAAAMSADGTTAPMRIWGLDYDVSGDRLFSVSSSGSPRRRGARLSGVHRSSPTAGSRCWPARAIRPGSLPGRLRIQFSTTCARRAELPCARAGRRRVEVQQNEHRKGPNRHEDYRVVLAE